MPFKRKNKSIESEWPDIAISGEISCSSRDDSIAFSYITSGSKCTSFHTTLSSLTKLINSKSINFHKPKVSVELLEILLCSCKKAIENSTKHAKFKQQKGDLGYNGLLRRVIFLLITFALFLHSVNASNLDLNIRRDSQTLALAHREKRHVKRPITYPNCSEDFQCPEDQVCKFRNLQSITGTPATLIGPEVNNLYHNKIRVFFKCGYNMYIYCIYTYNVYTYIYTIFR